MVIAVELVIIGILFVIIGCNVLKKDKKKSIGENPDKVMQEADKSRNEAQKDKAQKDSKKSEVTKAPTATPIPTLTPEEKAELERVILLKVVDTKWMAHIDDMDELKKGIGLRAFGQKNPVVEYRYEGFEMFDAMVEAIREDTVRMLLTVKLQKNVVPQREQVQQPDAPNAGAGDGSFSDERRSENKVGDNDPCPCGSGKKYKKCCKGKN